MPALRGFVCSFAETFAGNLEHRDSQRLRRSAGIFSGATFSSARPLCDQVALCDQVVDHVSVNIGESEVTPRVPIGESLMVDAHQV